MKKTFKFLSLAMLLSFVGTVSALADKITGTTQWDGDVQYKITAIRVLNGVVQKATVSVIDNATPKSGVTEVTIPDKVSLKVSGETDNDVRVSAQTYEFTVTEISKFGYANKNDVKKINIPATVKKIGADAFHNYASQSNIDLQIVIAAGSELETIGDCAFGNGAAKKIDLSNCNALDLRADSSDPERVLGTPFASRGTGENNQLQEVILPKGIQYIGTAFANLPKLTTLDLSQTGVTVLEEGALVGTSIKEVILPKVTNPTVQTVRIEDNAFGTAKKPSKVETLIIKAPIAADGAIEPDAFKEMPALKTVKFQGDITLPNAIPANAFTYTDNGAQKSSPIETLTFAGLGTKAISDNAFSGVSTLKSLVFTGTIAGGAIGKQAFAGIGTTAADCPAITFKQALLGENAIGEQAFLGAAAGSIKFTEDATIAAKAIASEAFKDLNTTKDCYASLRFESQLGERAIGQNAFENAHLQYVLFSKPINQIGAIRNYAFLNATILGSATADWAIQFLGDLTAQYSIGKGAFQGADIRKAIWFSGNVAGDGAKTPVITIDAFKDFKSTGVAGVPVLFKGDVTGNGVIDQQAFLRGSISTLTITGVIAGQNAIEEFAFAGLSNVGEINLGSRIYGDNEYSAIQYCAFAGSGKATTVLNIGDLKSTNAIAAGAFAGATFDIVNFSRLMAEEAIAADQFGGILASRMMEPTDGQAIEGLNSNAASINTVNFNQEFKAWPEAWENASKNFIGSNAFSNTGVSQVNFNEPVSVADAIVAYDAEDSPFAENGKEMKVDFKKGVVAGGIGAYAFANSNVIEITLAEDAIYEEEAFAAHSFYGISWEKGKTPNAVIKYAPKSSSLADRAFAQTAFYDETNVIDIQFKTTKEVLDLYTAENNASDLTPYRIKGLASKYIEVIRQPDGTYAGIFSPENEMYVIEKYQESGAEVGVWSAYADDLTLEATGDQFIANGRDKYKADLYINPLRVQDKGKYVLNAGHTLIVTAENAAWTEPIEKVIATQDLGKHKDGGVQTFAGLSPWACNDLRWNPAESNSNNWGGYVNWAAIDNGDKDIYGNVVRDYELFRQYNFATQGLGFGNSINIPEDQAYILVASLGAEQVTNRIKYSEYDHNAEWFTKNGISWEKSVAELIADAVALAVAGETEATDKYNGLIEKLQKAAGTDDEPSTLTDEDALIAAVMQKIIDQHLSENKDLQDEIIKLADELLPLVKNYAKALCDLRNAKEAVDRLNRIPAAEEEVDPYNFAGKFSDYLDRINSSKKALQDDIAELDEYLTVAAGDEQGDDMYKKYLALKALAGNAAEGQALYDEFMSLPSQVQDVLAASPADRKNTRVTGYNGDYQMVKALEELKQTYYDFRDKYLAWTGENPDPRNSFTFDVTKLQESELDLEACDALFTISQDNIDLPSTFYNSVQEAAEEAEAQAKLFEDWEAANKAIEDNKDVHAQAAFDNILWTKKDHYTVTLHSNGGAYSEVVGTLDVFAVNSNSSSLPDPYIVIGRDGYSVYPFVLRETQEGFEPGIYGVIGNEERTAFGIDENSITSKLVLVRVNGTGDAWETLDGKYATMLTRPNETLDYLPMAAYKEDPYQNNAFETLLVNTGTEDATDLYDQDINILEVNTANLNEESKRCYDLLKSMKGLIDNGYVVPEQFNGTKYQYDGPWYSGDAIDSDEQYYALPDLAGLDDTADEVKEAAEEARDKANNWVVAWYTQADEIFGQSSSFDVTYDKEMQKLADQKAIADLDAELEALMAIEDPYDGSSACQNYLDAVEALGTPAVEDDPATEEVETAEATGAYLAVDTAKEAKDDKVDELKDVVNGIEVSSARLNIIWNDGSHGDIVGIMESVVKNSATEAGNNAIYNLNGMRVKNAGKGIYIQNGKKFIK